jgi:hypothetical protein
MIAFGAGCASHRAALVDFVDRRERGPATEAALDHLDRCRACEWELEATAMAVMALRRLHDEAVDLEPPPDAWERLRVRVTRPRETVWRWRASLGGLAVGAGLVATIIAPTSSWSPRSTYLQEAGLEPSIFEQRRLAEQQAEQRILDQQRATRTGPVPQIQVAQAARVAVPATAVWAGPDGLGTSGVAPPTPEPSGVRST